MTVDIISVYPCESTNRKNGADEQGKPQNARLPDDRPTPSSVPHSRCSTQIHGEEQHLKIAGGEIIPLCSGFRINKKCPNLTRNNICNHRCLSCVLLIFELLPDLLPIWCCRRTRATQVLPIDYWCSSCDIDLFSSSQALDLDLHHHHHHHHHPCMHASCPPCPVCPPLQPCASPGPRIKVSPTKNEAWLPKLNSLAWTSRSMLMFSWP